MQAIFCYNATMNKNDDSKITLSEQDANLWEEFSAGVKRKETARKTEIVIEKKPVVMQKKSTPVRTVSVTTVPLRQPSPQPPVRIGDPGGIDAALFRRMKRGNVKIESRLDLHAMTKEQAWKQVSAWIPTCRNNNKRCLLLVTGKGSGILQSSVPLFLNHTEIRPHVLCCMEAAPKDGGTGAFYIYLKRS